MTARKSFARSLNSYKHIIGGALAVWLVLSLAWLLTAEVKYRIASAQDWKAATGKIISVAPTNKFSLPNMLRQRGRKWVVEYSYTIDGQIYSSNRCSFADQPFGDECVEFKPKFKAGDSVNVYYNPSRPSESALSNEDPIKALLFANLGACIVICVFLAILCGLFVWESRWGKPGRK